MRHLAFALGPRARYLAAAVALVLAGCDDPTAEPRDDVRDACAETCAAYASCGCWEKCAAWCEMYLDWDFCQEEIDALILCAANHPDPCTWELEPMEAVRCRDESEAFLFCSGNDFFPLPGATEGCQP